MNKIISLMLLILLIITKIYAQDIIDSSTSKRPNWLKEAPKGEYYIYFTGMTTSESSLDKAKEIAISNALSEIIMRKEVIVESDIKTFEKETEDELITRITKEIKLKGTSTAINGLEKEEEYWELVETSSSVLYRYWVLMKIPKKKYLNYDFTKKELEKNYGIAPIIKSAFVPGWGQIQKKETMKGVLLLSGFVVTITTGVITNNISKSYQKDAESASGAEWISYYNDLSDQYFLVSMISFVLSGAIYGYNLFDVISSKGAKIYAFNEDKIIHLTLCKESKRIQLKLTMEI